MKIYKRFGIMLMVFLITINMTTFAAIPDFSVIIGGNGYSLEYVNDEQNSDEITGKIIENPNIYVKTSEEWYDNLTSKKVSTDNIPYVIYRENDGTICAYDKNDGEKIKFSLLTEGDKNINGNLYIDSDNRNVRDITVNGSVYINPGEDGSTNLTNVNAKEIVVLSGGENSIHLNNVEADKLNIYSENKVRVEINESTKINNTSLYSSAIIDSKSGSFGEITIAIVNNRDKLSVVELRGDFAKIIIDNKSKINIRNAKIQEFIANVDAQIDIDKYSEIDKFHKKGNEIKITGDGEINIQEEKSKDDETNSEENTNSFGRISLDNVENQILYNDGEQKQITINATEGAKVNVYCDDENIVDTSLEGNELTIKPQNIGMTTVTIIGTKENYYRKSISFDVIVKDKFALNDVKVLSEGNKIGDFQLGFIEPKEEISNNEFKGWLMMYSTKSLEEVEEYITQLSIDDIEDYCNTDETNRIYKITNYGWADGLANTFRPNQKDVVTGREFETGEYHFYAAVYTIDGIINVSEADKIVDIKPSPKDVVLSGQGVNIENYSVTFSSFNDERIKSNAIFYSKKGIYDIKDMILDQSLNYIQELNDENRLKLISELEGTITFNEQQKDIEGMELGEDVYYVYAIAIGEDKVLGISQPIETIITAKVPEAKTEIIGDGNGTVLPAGGHTSSTDPDAAEFYEFIRNRAGGGTPRIAILSSSRDSLDVAYNHYYFDDPQYGSLEDNFTNLGFEPVYIPIAINSAYFVADNEYYAGLIKTCDAVFLQGGDQNKHAKSLLHDDGTDTEIMKAIRYVYSRGGIIAGTSAGMAVMGQYAYGYGDTDIALQTNNTEDYTIADIPEAGDLFPEVENNNLIVPGINVLPPNVLTDTHFDVRGRLGRFLVGLRDTGKEIGIGADEGTALAIKENIGEVVGNHGVYIVDVSQAHFTEEGSEVFGSEGVVINYLTEGDKYNFETKEVIVAENKELVTENSAIEIYETDDIFGADYETTKTILSFAKSDATSIEREVKTAGDPFFIAKFYKDENTDAYTSTLNYLDENLEGYNKMTILGMNLDVVEDDIVAPELKEITMDGPIITLNYNETLDKESVPSCEDYTIKTTTGSAISIITASGITINTNEVIITLEEEFTENDEITLSYSKGDNPIRDIVGNEAAEFVDKEVINELNNNEKDIIAPKIASISDSDKYYILVTFNESNTIDESTITVENIILDGGNEFYYVNKPWKNFNIDNTPGNVSIEITAYNEVSEGNTLTFTSNIKDSSGNAMIEEVWIRTSEGTWVKK